jgi:Bardet-Biedl syndrome 2 protein
LSLISLSSGNLSEEKNMIPRDYLLVGTQSTLSAYDVQRNSDIFFRDVSDGVNTLIVGTLGNLPPYVFAGGNCSVLGFKSTGAETFWTVSGDNVSALALSDINGDGLNELIVGSDDYEIRFFQNEEMIAEQTEADKIEFLSSIDRTLFSYGLANGSVGVYTGPKNRLWRVKTKHKVTSLITFDLNCDGVPEVISGWSNGLLNIRSIDNGETLYKQIMPSPIASLVKGDYRLDGKEELIVCSVHGTISGYLPIDFETIPLSTNANPENGTSNGPAAGGQLSNDQKMLDEMQAKKVELSNDLKQIEKTIKTLKSGESLPPGSLPPETQLSYSFVADPLRKGILLTVEASTDVQVSSIIVIDLGPLLLQIFLIYTESVILAGSEILTVTPSLPTRQISVLIRPTRNAPASLRVQVMSDSYFSAEK